MSRKQARFLVGLTVLVLLTIVGYRLNASLSQQRSTEARLREINPNPVEAAEQRMLDFRRIKMRDGKKIWEIAAQQARYSEESNEVVVDNPEFSLYLKDGDVIELKSKQAHLHLSSNDREIVRIELKGDLEMRIADFAVTTQEAIFESTPNTITSTEAVQINGPGIQIAGQGYTVDIASKRLTLGTDVRTLVSQEARS